MLIHFFPVFSANLSSVIQNIYRFQFKEKVSAEIEVPDGSIFVEDKIVVEKSKGCSEDLGK